MLVGSHNMAEVAEICDRVSIIHEGHTVWEGTQSDLHLAAPAAAHRVWTSDDDRAGALARGLPLRVETGGRRPQKSTGPATTGPAPSPTSVPPIASGRTSWT